LTAKLTAKPMDFSGRGTGRWTETRRNFDVPDMSGRPQTHLMMTRIVPLFYIPLLLLQASLAIRLLGDVVEELGPTAAGAACSMVSPCCAS
jgi:hypothetical protein